MRYIMPPVMRLSCAIVGHVEQVAVSHSHKIGGNSDNDLGRSPVVRCVMARKPVAVITRLSQCPGLDGARWIFPGRLDKMQPCARLRLIFHSYREIFTLVIGAIQCYSKLLAISTKC